MLAEQTSGQSRFLTPRERVDIPALDPLAGIGRPIAVDVTVSVEGGVVSPAPLGKVFGGAPLLVFGEVAPDLEGTLSVSWQEPAGARRELALRIDPAQLEAAETVRLMRGSKLIADLESRALPEDAPSKKARKAESAAAARLLELSQEYGLASGRCLSLPWCKERETAQAKLRLPALCRSDFRRIWLLTVFSASPRAPQSLRVRARWFLPRQCAVAMTWRRGRRRHRARWTPHSLEGIFARSTPPLEPSIQTSEDILVTLAGMLEPDGGMPGKTEEERIANSLAALLYFAECGSSAASGAFPCACAAPGCLSQGRA